MAVKYEGEDTDVITLGTFAPGSKDGLAGIDKGFFTEGNELFELLYLYFITGNGLYQKA